MKEMLRSFRIFTAQYTLKVMLQTVLIMLGIYAVVSGLSFISFDGSDFGEGFLMGFLPSFSMVIPICGSFMLNAIYSYNMQINPGYKYMHSIKDSGKKYVQAIIVGNMLSLVILGIAMFIIWTMTTFLDVALPPALSAVLAFAVLSMINFTGNAKKQWIRILAIMPLFVLVGFFSGFSSAAEHDNNPIPEFVVWICLAVAVVAFIASLIYTIKTSEKKWRRDEI